MQTVEWVVGDTEPLAGKAVKHDGATPLDLTGASGTFSMWPANGGTVKVNASAISVTGEAAGEWEYRWIANDVDTAGRYYARATFTRSGKIISTEKLLVVMEAKVG